MKADDIIIYVLVVIYNKPCANSSTCSHLEGIDGVKVVIIDNSTREYGNLEYANEKGWDFIGMRDNVGLSKAYNKAVEHITDNEAFMCLFDDDSEIDEKYFTALREALAKSEDTKIFIPYTYDQYGLFSPSVEIRQKVRRAKNISEVNPYNITAINNGMAIKREVFENYRYNEDYFLDYVDHAFLRDMRNMGVKISMMDAKLYHQTMFASDDSTKENVALRFKIFRKDLKTFYCNSFKGWLLYFEMIFRMKVNFTLRFRSIKMMFI